LEGSATISDFVEARSRTLLKMRSNDLGDEEIKQISKLVSGKQTDHKPNISKENLKSVMKVAIWPIKKAIKNVTSEYLGDFESSFDIGDFEGTKEKIENIKKVIDNYNSNSSTKIKNILKNLDDDTILKIKSLVFPYNSKLYKISGQYEAVKKILKIYQNKIGDKIPLGKNTDKLKENESSFRSHPKNSTFADNKIALIPGSFKPPHSGHYELARHMLDMKEADGSDVIDELVILISPKSRTGHSPNNRIIVTAEMSKQMWDMYFEGQPNVSIELSNRSSPIRSTFDFMSEYMSEGDILWVAQGEKDKDDSRYEKLQDFSDVKNLGIDVEVETTELYSRGVSGAQMRHYLAEKDEDSFKGFLPDHLTAEERDQLYDLVMKNQPNKKIVNEMHIPIDNPIKMKQTREKILKESGGVASHGGDLGPVRRDFVSDVTPDERVPHQKPASSGNDKIKEDAKGPKGVAHIKSLRKQLKDLETKVRETEDNDEISTLNNEIDHVRDKIDDAKQKLISYFVNNFSELDIDEISSGGGGAVAGSPNPGHNGDAQSQETVRRARSNN